MIRTFLLPPKCKACKYFKVDKTCWCEFFSREKRAVTDVPFRRYFDRPAKEMRESDAPCGTKGVYFVPKKIEPLCKP